MSWPSHSTNKRKSNESPGPAQSLQLKKPRAAAAAAESTIAFEDDKSRIAFLLMTVKTLQRECVGLKAENKILKNKVLQLTEELDSKMKMITEPTSGPNLSFPSSPTNASDGLPVQQNTLRPKPLVTLRPRGGRSLFPNTGEIDATQHKQSPSVPIPSTPHTGRSHQPRPDTGAKPVTRSFSQQTSMPQTLTMSGGTPGYGDLKGKGKASVYVGAASASRAQYQSPYSHLYGPGMPPPTYPPPQGQTGWYNRGAQL